MLFFFIEYDPDRHGHYLPGPKLEIEYTDLVELPTKFWFENISGHSAMICWSSSKFLHIKLINRFHFFNSVDTSSSTNIQPDGYKLLIWNNKELTHDNPMILTLTSKIF